jgi:soluble lytic murein transglycosylase-like protein
MTAFKQWDTWRQTGADVARGVRHVSHHALAVVGLGAVLTAVFLSTRPELRHQLETDALAWLSDRALARLAPDSAPGDAPRTDNILLAMAEPDAIQRATAADLSELNRQQQSVVQWISRRYSVAQEPISRLVQEAWSVGKAAGVEPTLILAIMAMESSFNPFAQSHVGAQGLMQVMTGIHRDKYEAFGGKRAAFDPVTNLRVGVQVLKECISRGGSLEEGLKYYVGAANLAHDGGYASRVLAEQRYLLSVAAGRHVPTNATLPAPGAVIEASATQAPPTVPTFLPEGGASGVTGSAPAASPAPSAGEAPVNAHQATGEQVAMAR